MAFPQVVHLNIAQWLVGSPLELVRISLDCHKRGSWGLAIPQWGQRDTSVSIAPIRPYVCWLSSAISSPPYPRIYWCGWPDLNRQGRSRGIFIPTTAFAAAFRRLWSGLSLHHGFRFRRSPSSLYTFPIWAWLGPNLDLARDCHFTGFPEFDEFYSQRFRRGTQTFSKSLVFTNFTTPALILCQ